MVISIRDVIRQSVNAYAVTPRRQWVIEWPGQIAICVSCIYWTSEVTEAMTESQGMKVSSAITAEDFLCFVRILCSFSLPGLTLWNSLLPTVRDPSLLLVLLNIVLFCRAYETLPQRPRSSLGCKDCCTNINLLTYFLCSSVFVLVFSSV